MKVSEADKKLLKSKFEYSLRTDMVSGKGPASFYALIINSFAKKGARPII